jgi:hypothetical protein
MLRVELEAARQWRIVNCDEEDVELQKGRKQLGTLGKAIDDERS